MNRLNKCKEVLKKVLKDKGRHVGLMTLRSYVIRYIGSDEYRVVRHSLKLMLEVGLIKEIDAGRFMIVEDKINEND